MVRLSDLEGAGMRGEGRERGCEGGWIVRGEQIDGTEEKGERRDNTRRCPNDQKIQRHKMNHQTSQSMEPVNIQME